MLDEQGAIGIQKEIGRRSSERLGDRHDSVLSSLDLHECSDRGFVDGDRDVFRRVLLAIFLVPEPDMQADFLEHTLHDLAVADHGFVLVANFHRSGEHGTLEREQAPARFGPDAQHAPAMTERFIFGVEQRVLLQAPRTERRRPGGENRRARFFRAGETEFDFPLDHQRHVGASTRKRRSVYHKRMGRPARKEKGGSQRRPALPLTVDVPYSLVTTTAVSWPLRRMRRMTVPPDGTRASSRLASATLPTFARPTRVITSPSMMPALAAGLA